MPLFEYACRACGHHFEFLTRADKTAACPACTSADLEKQLSAFAVAGTAVSSSKSAAAAPCDACGDPAGEGSCAIKYPTSSLN